MPLKTFVKVGRITNLSDARYCAGMGVDALGFTVTEGSPDYVSPQHFQEMRGWINGPMIVVEIAPGAEPDIHAIISAYQPDVIECDLASYQRLLKEIEKPFIVRLPQGLSHFQEALPFKIIVDPIFSGDYPSTVLMVEVNSLAEFEAVRNRTPLPSISLSGGREDRPGFKAYDLLQGVLEELEYE